MGREKPLGTEKYLDCLLSRDRLVTYDKGVLCKRESSRKSGTLSGGKLRGDADGGQTTRELPWPEPLDPLPKPTATWTRKYAFPILGAFKPFENTWGARRSHGNGHLGVDIFAALHTKVGAFTDGRISMLAYFRGAGLTIRLNGNDGLAYEYMHLEKVTPEIEAAFATVKPIRAGKNDWEWDYEVKEVGGRLVPYPSRTRKFVDTWYKLGSRVTVKHGDHIAYVGDSGCPGKLHLHFQALISQKARRVTDKNGKLMVNPYWNPFYLLQRIWRDGKPDPERPEVKVYLLPGENPPRRLP